jgi:hypothetical protein
MRARTVLAVLLVLGCGAWFAPVAGADGDPASDVLLVEDAFYPYSPAVSKGLAERLHGATTAARAAHYTTKVALIASPNDLGAATVLFGKPQSYAQFLAAETRELASYQLLLVVMPGGYGVSGGGPGAQRLLAGLPKPAGGTSDDLTRAALVALPRLAAAAGHPLANIPDVPITSPQANGWKPPAIAILALGAILVVGAIIVIRQRRERRR